jgi:Tfp pilus assembly protein FimT
VPFHGEGQSGFGLLEALIGMVMVMLLIGAGATGLQTLRRTSSGANNAARLDALLVGTGEAIKRTEYKSCAEAADYDAAVKAFEDTRLPAERIQQTASGGQPSLQVDGVVLAPGCTDTSTREILASKLSTFLRRWEAQAVPRRL